jgi:hypothetical protein
MDFDAFEERAAIMEFCGGLSRFRAETLAAQSQGYQRKDMLAGAQEQAKEARRDMTGYPRMVGDQGASTGHSAERSDA